MLAEKDFYKNKEVTCNAMENVRFLRTTAKTLNKVLNATIVRAYKNMAAVEDFLEKDTFCINIIEKYLEVIADFCKVVSKLNLKDIEPFVTFKKKRVKFV